MAASSGPRENVRLIKYWYLPKDGTVGVVGEGRGYRGGL